MKRSRACCLLLSFTATCRIARCAHTKPPYYDCIPTLLGKYNYTVPCWQYGRPGQGGKGYDGVKHDVVIPGGQCPTNHPQLSEV